MPLAKGCHHIAILTEDLDRFVAFYRRIFDAELLAEGGEGPLRHALVDVGGMSLHPFEFLEDPPPETRGRFEAFTRGHVDHLALDMGDEETFQTVRRRLVEAGASEGRLADFGMVRLVSFVDPDGMEAEIALWADGPMRSMSERTMTPFEG